MLDILLLLGGAYFVIVELDRQKQAALNAAVMNCGTTPVGQCAGYQAVKSQYASLPDLVSTD
jgi:hypothetical protein